MKIDAPESGVFPESCVQGPGWQRTHFKEDICSLVIRLDYLQEQYFLVKAKTKCKDNNDIPFDTICDNSTKAMEVKKGTSSIHVIVVSILSGLIIPAGILVNVLVCFCSQCHEEGSFFCWFQFFSLLKSLENVVCSWFWINIWKRIRQTSLLYCEWPIGKLVICLHRNVGVTLIAHEDIVGVWICWGNICEKEWTQTNQI